MKIIRTFPFLAFVLVMLALVTVSLAQRDMMWLLMTATLAVLSWYVTESRWQLALPHWVSNILVIGASLNVLRDLAQHDGDVLGALGRFAVLLTLIKLYERKTARDYAQLLSLTLLLMLVATFRSMDLLNGVLLLVYTALGMYVAMSFQLYNSFELAKSARSAARTDTSLSLPPLKPTFGRHPLLHLRTTTTALAIVGLLLSAVFFLVFPRGVGAEFLGRVNLGRSEQVSGFAPSLSLQSSTHISTSQMRAMTVQFLDERDQPARVEEPAYLRGVVLDHYRGQGRWSQGDDDARQIILNPPPSAQPVWLRADVSNPVQPLKQAIDMRFSTEVLFALEHPVTIAAPFSPLAEPDIRYFPRTEMMQSSRPGTHPRVYTVVSDLQPPDATDQPRNRRRASWRDRRFDDDGAQSVTALARAIVKPLAPPARNTVDWSFNRQAAELITQHLQSARYSYSLDTSDIVLDSAEGADADPVIAFLTRTRKGHCEYFAAGMTALCHTLGVEARIVIGFLAYNWDPAAQRYNILQSNAHAWVEVRTGPGEWTRFDPTPPSVIPVYHRANANLLSQLNWTYNDLQQNWNTAVVDFDSAAQSTLRSRLDFGWAGRISRAVDAVQTWMASVNRFFNLGPGGYIWMGIVGLCIVLAVAALVTLMNRSREIDRRGALRHLHHREYQRMLRLLGFYVDALHVLERANHPKPAWQPPMQFARRLGRTHPAAADLLADLSRTFYAIRFGGHRPSALERKAIRAKVQSLSHTLELRRV